MKAYRICFFRIHLGILYHIIFRMENNYEKNKSNLYDRTRQ